jgi:hypothetical protein
MKLGASPSSRKERGELTRDLTPDRADNVRARIARLDQFLAEADGLS